MFLPKITPSNIIFFGLVFAIILASIQLSQAKSVRSMGYYNLKTGDANKMRRGGCAAFGHSCFGGHGKRADSSINFLVPEYDPTKSNKAVDDAKPSLFDDQLQIPFQSLARDESEFEKERNPVQFSQYGKSDFLKLASFLRKFLSDNNFESVELPPGKK